MDKQSEQRIKELEQRIAALEGQVQAQPTVKEIAKIFFEKLKFSSPL